MLLSHNSISGLQTIESYLGGSAFLHNNNIAKRYPQCLRLLRMKLSNPLLFPVLETAENSLWFIKMHVQVAKLPPFNFWIYGSWMGAASLTGSDQSMTKERPLFQTMMLSWYSILNWIHLSDHLIKLAYQWFFNVKLARWKTFIVSLKISSKKLFHNILTKIHMPF